jgi:hypothetical protein
MSRVRLIPFVFVLALAASPAAALSSGLVVEITNVFDDSLGTGLGVGDLIRGDFAHADCADQACRDFYAPTLNEGVYIQLSVAMDLVLGAIHAVSGNGPYFDEVVIRNDFGATGYDLYDAAAEQFDSVSVTPTPRGVIIDYWTFAASVILIDDDGEVFDFGYIPTVLPPLNQFETRSFQVTLFAALLDEFGDPSPEFLRFDATGTIVALPEPSTVVLVALGLIGLAARRGVTGSRSQSGVLRGLAAGPSRACPAGHPSARRPRR